ncbi:DUF721 domain-containing protein [Thalassococcus sp. S3]|uniref:DUF721 domain-containing protein n=1 Tax=Thalassococcus sp. S3 TaxID=2017482 RepID=UPI0010248556|nr:DciA family protein [Thalassococcus sp. S3]QBF33814.1 RNA-binding protein [Thalassococcus sp. S3]
MPRRRSTTFGFKQTSALLGDRIRRAGESRGFAVSRLLTHWDDVVGADICKIARPVNISYGRGGLGATLTLLTTGAQAPMLEMQKEQLRHKVNAVYGYNAISHIRITQTAPTGFSEGKVAFEARPRDHVQDAPRPEVAAAAKETAAPVEDEDLRNALERLGRNVMTKHTMRKGV